MTSIRNKDVFNFLIVYYAGYTDASEMQASFTTKALDFTLIEGIDYDQANIWQLHAIAWALAVIESHKGDNLVTEIKLLGVDHDTINI